MRPPARRHTVRAALVASPPAAAPVAGGWTFPTRALPNVDRTPGHAAPGGRGVAPADERAHRDALAATSDSILAAFARGDTDAAMVHHHPRVVKAFAVADSALCGREAVRATVAGAFRHARVELVENRVESLVVHGDAAVELTRFAIRSTPRRAGDGAPTTFRGRTMVVYVPSPASPAEWVPFRELLQPAAN